VAGNAYDEALIASERARLMFEDDAAHAEWLDSYFALIAEGWSWRQAVYMIWASQPKPRTPATEKALATQVLGLTSARSIRTWKAENPHMELRIRKLSLAALGHARNEVLQALIESAQTPSYRNYRDRELFLKMTRDYVPRERLDVGAVSSEQDLAALSAEELAAQAQIPVDHGRAPAGQTLAEEREVEQNALD
jgi:hypothetical protein